jgi:acetoin utilization deacetylase AcuC-like enzyme
MATLLFTHPACLRHDPGPGHPESPDRLAAILAAFQGLEFAGLIRREAPRAALAVIERVHPADFVERCLARVPQTGYAEVDGDTILSPDSGEAALRAAGALCAAVDGVMAGEGANAFCAVRPPGHHAEPSRAMGFCLFNNVAIGALHARAAHGCERVAVIDFDVHHGNGTQAAFERDPGLFFASAHQSPLYPGTGMADEHGVGNIVNVPLRPGSGSAEFHDAMSRIILPALTKFRPDFVLISAGFDAHRADPLANLELTEEDFAWVTREILGIAKSCCAGRVVATLEGGYDLAALAACAGAHVRELMAAR